jgi:hypothetical protein
MLDRMMLDLYLDVGASTLLFAKIFFCTAAFFVFVPALIQAPVVVKLEETATLLENLRSVQASKTSV